MDTGECIEQEGRYCLNRFSQCSFTQRHDRAKRTCVDGAVFDANHIEVRVLTQEEGAGKVVIFG